MPASKAQQRAVAKYEATHYDKFLVRVPKGKKAAIQAHVEAEGCKSFNAFVLQAIDAALSNDSDMVNILADKVKTLEEMLEARERKVAILEASEVVSVSIDSDMIKSDSGGLPVCLYCGKVFEGTNKRKKFCSDNCRKYHHRKMKS